MFHVKHFFARYCNEKRETFKKILLFRETVFVFNKDLEYQKSSITKIRNPENFL